MIVAKETEIICIYVQICNSEEIWKQTVLGHCNMITQDMEMLAKAMGWKNIFFKFYYKTEHEEEYQANTASP